MILLICLSEIQLRFTYIIIHEALFNPEWITAKVKQIWQLIVTMWFMAAFKKSKESQNMPELPGCVNSCNMLVHTQCCIFFKMNRNHSLSNMLHCFCRQPCFGRRIFWTLLFTKQDSYYLYPCFCLSSFTFGEDPTYGNVQHIVQHV